MAKLCFIDEIDYISGCLGSGCQYFIKGIQKFLFDAYFIKLATFEEDVFDRNECSASRAKRWDCFGYEIVVVGNAGMT
jgi:hypothetical protein